MSEIVQVSLIFGTIKRLYSKQSSAENAQYCCESIAYLFNRQNAIFSEITLPQFQWAAKTYTPELTPRSVACSIGQTKPTWVSVTSTCTLDREIHTL